MSTIYTKWFGRSPASQKPITMTPSLTIRNITATPLELKLIERFEAPGTSQNATTPNTRSDSPFGKIGQNFTTLMSNVTTTIQGPTQQQLEANAQSFTHQDVSIRAEPFEVVNTKLPARERDNEIIRLTFEVQGQRYRMDAYSPSNRSITLTPLQPSPAHEFTAIYLPTHSYLAIFSSAKLDSWMGKLKDHIPLSSLSIPGTHNSPTHYKALPSVRCQAVSLEDQLNNGVRFLDIRVQVESPEDTSSDRLILVHSAFPVSLTGNKYFRELLNTVTHFLDTHPSETVIMSIKREGTGSATDAQLSKRLHDHYINPDQSRWYTDNATPRLGSVRRKIVLLRRFHIDPAIQNFKEGKGFGLDASQWPDNCEDGLCSGGTIRVQDFYEVEETVNIDKKIRFSHSHLERAASMTCPLAEDTSVQSTQQPNPFFVNFLSASNFFRPGCWPDRVARKVNPAIVDFLCRRHNETEGVGTLTLEGDAERCLEKGDGSTGIVVCDYVGDEGDWDLVRAIVGHNARLQLRGGGC